MHRLTGNSLQFTRWFAAVLVLLLMASQLSAQSGRRAPRTVRSPNATVSSEDSASRKPLTALAREVTLLIGKQPTSKNFVAEGSIFASFIKRLNEYSGIKGSLIGDLKRNEAVRRARAETDALVVLLRFDIDSFQEGTILLNSHDLVVEYAVFAPKTGKQKTKGKVYYQEVGGGRLRKSEWPTGTPIRITTEATGNEAAEQLYAWISLLVGIKPALQ